MHSLLLHRLQTPKNRVNRQGFMNFIAVALEKRVLFRFRLKASFSAFVQTIGGSVSLQYLLAYEQIVDQNNFDRSNRS